MNTHETFVIVGAGLAGSKAAETLRTEGFTGRIVLVGEEPERPYERPPLSKDYLRGDLERQKVFVHDDGFYAEHEIELRTATGVNRLDGVERTVTLDRAGTEEVIRFDRLLLTTGSEPRVLDVPGRRLPGVSSLRSLADADVLKEAGTHSHGVAIIGAGWIGCEVAATLRQRGHDVAMITPAAVPFERVLGPEVGAVFRDLHADHGVELHLGKGVDALRGRDTVEEVVLGDGSRILADVVVVGIGARPRIELAAAAGLTINDGIAVDAQLRTSDSNIFAAGDVASAMHPVFGPDVRVEHWANALHQGPAAARNMLGIATPYDRIPYFFSDQYELGMEYSGYAPAWDEVVFRGDPARGEFIAFWLSRGVVVAGMNVNVWDVTTPIQALVRSQSRVDPARLADPDVPIHALTSSSNPTAA